MRVDESILVVVDVQNGFVTEKSQHALPMIVKLLDQWKDIGGTTVCTRYFNYPGSAFERMMNWEKLYDPPDTDIADSLVAHVYGSITLDKYAYSAATQEFADLVRTHNWTNVAICGIDTDLCVLKTALDIFEQDLTPWVITDASASTGGDNLHKAGLAVLSRAIGERHLVTVEEFLRMF